LKVQRGAQWKVQGGALKKFKFTYINIIRQLRYSFDRH